MAYIGRGLDNGVRNQFVYAATQGQTAFTGADSDGKTLAMTDILYTDCYQNGVKLKPTTDYTVSLTTLTLISAASLNDVINIVSFDIFAVPDTVPASTGGTFNGGIGATTGTFSGDVEIGTSADFGDTFNVSGTGHLSNNVTLSRQGNDAGSTGLIFEKTRNTSVNGNTVVQSGDQLGYVAFRGNDGDQFLDGAYILGFVDGTPGNNDMPTRMSFHTTADGASSPTERMRITSAGNVGIGETDPDSTLTVKGAAHTNFQVKSNSESTKAFIQTVQDSDVRIGSSTNHPVAFYQNGGEVMRISANGSGKRFTMGTTSPLNGGGAMASFVFSGAQGVFISTVNQSGGQCMGFVHQQSSVVGSINITSSATQYATSSDYRLKENVDYTWDATTRLKQLKPARFNFIADDTNTLVDGFIAHEVSSIVPEAVTGAKDAMAVETRYTADDVETQGDTPSKNVGDPKTYSSSKIDSQGIDQSKLVPLLVKALQEQQIVIESLTTRITALEAE